MNTAPIGDLVKKARQIDPKKLGRDQITYIDIASIDRENKSIALAQVIRSDEAPSRARKQVQANDVLVATVRPNLNAVARVSSQYNDEIASTGFCVLRPDEKLLDSNYLFFYVRTNDFISRLTQLATGAGYPAVSDDIILETEIPLPPLPEQQRIAAILDRADRLRRTRRYAAQLSDSFLQAVFIEMFGDPVMNPKGWAFILLEELAQLRSGFAFSSNDYQSDGVKLVRISNLDGYGLTFDADSVYLSDSFLTDNDVLVLQGGDVLIAMSGATTGKLGMVSNKDLPCLLNQRVGKFFIMQQERLLPAFLFWMLSFPKVQRKILELAGGSAQPNISPSQMGSLLIALPPLAHQEKFARIVQQFDRLRAQQREADRQAEMLFRALLNRAFVERS